MIVSVLRKTDKILGRMENTILFLGMATALFVSLLNVVMRYVFSYPLTWPPELARYCNVLVVFIGASAAIKAGTHLKVDVLYQFFPYLEGFSHYFRSFIIIIFSISVIVISKNIVYMQYITNQKSIAMGIPFFILYAIPGIAAFFMFLRSIIEIINNIKDKSKTQT